MKLTKKQEDGITTVLMWILTLGLAILITILTY